MSDWEVKSKAVTAGGGARSGVAEGHAREVGMTPRNALLQRKIRRRALQRKPKGDIKPANLTEANPLSSSATNGQRGKSEAIGGATGMEPVSIAAGRLLSVWVDLERLRPALEADPARVPQLQFLLQQVEFLTSLVQRSATDPGLVRSVEVGTDFAAYSVDLMRLDLEATGAGIAGALRRTCNFGLQAAWGGLKSLRADPAWATKAPDEMQNMLRIADDMRDQARNMASTAMVGKAGVNAASMANVALSVVELTSAGVTAFARVVDWMKGARIQSGVLEFAGSGGGVPAFRIVAPAGALVLTEAEVVALAQAGRIPAAALQLYMMSQGRGFAAVLGEGPEVGAVHETSTSRAGLARPPRHHALPQEHRAWFEERGFKGHLDIDHFTVELEESTHQAVHGGGSRQLAKQWPGEWNRLVMDRLKDAELRLGRKLTPDEIVKEVKALMKRYDIDGPFQPFKGD